MSTPDSPTKAALDCAKAKFQMDTHKAIAKDAEEQMKKAKERILMYEDEKLKDPAFKHLNYPVGVFEPCHPAKVLQLRRNVSIAKGKIYTQENQAILDKLGMKITKIQLEIDAVPFTPENHEVVSWSVWMFNADDIKNAKPTPGAPGAPDREPMDPERSDYRRARADRD